MMNSWKNRLLTGSSSSSSSTVVTPKNPSCDFLKNGIIKRICYCGQQLYIAYYYAADFIQAGRV
jgi:hypothetical protein